jgi:hypothetical protein
LSEQAVAIEALHGLFGYVRLTGKDMNEHYFLLRVRPEVVDFGSGQGRRNSSPFAGYFPAKREFPSDSTPLGVETDGVAVKATTARRQATSRISKERERRRGPKDTIYGWTLAHATTPKGNQPCQHHVSKTSA